VVIEGEGAPRDGARGRLSQRVRVRKLTA